MALPSGWSSLFFITNIRSGNLPGHHQLPLSILDTFFARPTEDVSFDLDEVWHSSVLLIQYCSVPTLLLIYWRSNAVILGEMHSTRDIFFHCRSASVSLTRTNNCLDRGLGIHPRRRPQQYWQFFASASGCFEQLNFVRSPGLLRFK